MKNYMLYFSCLSEELDHDEIYFFDTLKELLKDFHCKTLEDFKEEFKNYIFCIIKLKEIVLENRGDDDIC